MWRNIQITLYIYLSPRRSNFPAAPTSFLTRQQPPPQSALPSWKKRRQFPKLANTTIPLYYLVMLFALPFSLLLLPLFVPPLLEQLFRIPQHNSSFLPFFPFAAASLFGNWQEKKSLPSSFSSSLFSLFLSLSQFCTTVGTSPYSTAATPKTSLSLSPFTSVRVVQLGTYYQAIDKQHDIKASQANMPCV